MLHKVMENVPHDPLEGPRCIAESKGHPPEGICAPIRDESSMNLIFDPDRSLVVSSHPIQKGIDTVACYMVQDHICEGQRVDILLCGFIQLPVVLAYPYFGNSICSQLLRCNHDWRQPFTVLHWIDELGL